MSNNQQIVITVVVDVDRRSDLYSVKAVQALDPTKKGPTAAINQTTEEADEIISRGIAIAACQRQLLSPLPDEFGGTTIRMTSPKNIQESLAVDLEFDREEFTEEIDTAKQTLKFDKT